MFSIEQYIKDWEIGWKIGFKEARMEAARSMLLDKDLKLSNAKIARLTGVSEYYVRKIEKELHAKTPVTP
ncbi:MAG TPA: hypothetical protein VL053_18105 [Arachidicoccus sp.]|nr:hypothetical protein [Arachidicoccus sp.]